MNRKSFRFGFRIEGDCANERRLVDWPAAFAGHADADPRAALDRETYLSAFTFGADFKEHLELTRSTRGFSGACWSPWLWLDIDRAGDLDAAKEDARRLTAQAEERWGLEGEVLIFFSGAKGFHLGLPASTFGAEPSADFNRIARRLAEGLAEAAGARIDSGIYDKVRAFRAPNSRHPKTGLHKRRLYRGELFGMATDAILRLAGAPEPFEVPDAPEVVAQAAADWRAAADALAGEAVSRARRIGECGNGAAGGLRLNRVTREFIGGVWVPPEGDRHRSLFSAAANLAEFGCPAGLAYELLGEPGRDTGLTPSEVRRQIECGLAHGGPEWGATQ